MMPSIEAGLSQSTSQAARSGPFSVSADFIVGGSGEVAKATDTSWTTIALIGGIALVVLLGAVLLLKRK